tara:strand:- start:78 stop:1241 length:1164 start_codon:yes stop_codon:yes gene_type:complete
LKNPFKFSLVDQTISNKDIKELSNWLLENNRLTKGELNDKFENKWSQWNNSENSIFVNSGSSANLVIFFAEQCIRKKQNLKVVIPAVSWSTTVAPGIQLGMNVILCDADEKTLGVSVDHLEKIFKKHNPDVLMIVHVLGHINDMDNILFLCQKYNVTLFEDCCESPGTEWNGIKVGNFGKAGSYSFYYGHHISTIEGGMVVTNDDDFSEIVKSLRSHGWSRDLSSLTKSNLKKKYKINDFKDQYTFYYPGFNLRSTDLNAFIGLKQLERIDSVINKRFQIYKRYRYNLEGNTWIQTCQADIISNFGMGLIIENINDVVKKLNNASVEIRPLVCGSIGEQPFWINYNEKQILPVATTVHNRGLYLPAHHNLSIDDVDKISDIVLEAIK